VKDAAGGHRVDHILDSAGQKGTGRWTATDALEQGIPLTLIAEAVNARFLSALKSERVEAEKLLGHDDLPGIKANAELIAQIRDALYASKIISYAQGFMLMRAAAEKYGWNLSYGDIALLWRGGCIIRSRFLGDIKNAYQAQPELKNLLLDDFFGQAIRKAEQGWRKMVVMGVEAGIPLPAFSSALAFYDGYRSGTLPANLIQAQRDYFGAHTYRRTDAPESDSFHTDWTGGQTESKQ